MKKLSFILLFTCAWIAAAFAETTDSSLNYHQKKGEYRSNFKKSYYFWGGGGLINNSDVNDHLDKLGYATFSPYALSLGFGGARQYKRLIHGHEFETLIWRRNKNENIEGMFSVGRVTSFSGIAVFSKPTFSLYPLIGLGFGMTSLKAGPKDVPFDSAFAIPSQLPPSSPLYQGTFLIDAGIGMYFIPPRLQKKHRKLAIGLRAGYIFDPVNNEKWYRNGITLTGGPDNNLSGPYVRLTIGKQRTPRCEAASFPCPRGKFKQKCPHTSSDSSN